MKMRPIVIFAALLVAAGAPWLARAQDSCSGEYSLDPREKCLLERAAVAVLESQLASDRALLDSDSAEHHVGQPDPARVIARKEAEVEAAKKAALECTQNLSALKAQRLEAVATSTMTRLEGIPWACRLPEEEARLEELQRSVAALPPDGAEAVRAADRCRNHLETMMPQLREMRLSRLDRPMSVERREWLEQQSCRFPEEEAALAAADDGRARAQAMIDAGGWSPIGSAKICLDQQIRANAAKEVKTEKRYAAELGGVVDMQRLHALQQIARAMDERVKARTASMKKAKHKVLPCTNAKVKLATKCIPPDYVEDERLLPEQDPADCTSADAKALVWLHEQVISMQEEE